MRFFGRRETLNEQLLREAGVDPAEALGDRPPAPPRPASSVLGMLGVPDGTSPGPREWDAAVAVSAPGLAGNRIEFTTLPNGDVIVSEESGDADLSPLADAVERHVPPPYRAVASRQDSDLWTVGAKRIEVARIPFPDGEKVALTQHGDERELEVDGERAGDAVPPELAQLGEEAGDSFYVEAERIDGDLWEVKVTAL